MVDDEDYFEDDDYFEEDDWDYEWDDDEEHFEIDYCEFCGSPRCPTCGQMTCFGCACDDEQEDDNSTDDE
jgi:hypothetical protein